MRQRELRAGRDRDTAVLELYEDIAYAWRLLQVGRKKKMGGVRGRTGKDHNTTALKLFKDIAYA